MPPRPDPAPAPYDRDFFAGQRDRSLRSARVVAPLVLSLVRPRSAVDFGCGVGAWLRALAELGVGDVLGLDGYAQPDQLLFDPARFRAADLTDPPPLGRAFDLAVCVEVAEHLPAAAAPRLVAALAAAAPCVLFSAALPGQGGRHHVHENWPGFWRGLFAGRGYDRLDPIRPRVWRESGVAWWYKQNLYLYCRRDQFASRPALERERELAEACPFELVHQRVFSGLTARPGRRD
jgi:SAM-dependent methyltransferase